MMRLLAAVLIGAVNAPGSMSNAIASLQDRPEDSAERVPGRPPEPTPALVRSIVELDDLRPGRAPLLREGSTLVQARGRVVHDEERSIWKFVIDGSDAAAPDHELILLPNSSLAELKQVIETAGDRSIAFELTGEVTIFHGRNYLLLTAPVRVLETRDRSAVESSSPPAASESDQSDDAEGSRSAVDVMRELERSSGPIQRAVPSSGRTAAMADNLAREGTTVLARRGKIAREASGAWQFVFDADASGEADPPVILLPCLLLERIEQLVQRRGRGTPLLISGEVMAFEGRNYLKLTAYQIPRERTVLNP